MYVISVLIIAIFMGLVCLLCYGAGVRMAANSEVRKGLRPLRLSKADAVLYRQAAKILNRLINITELKGEFGEDLLSSKTRQQIEEWLAAYQKEIDRP